MSTKTKLSRCDNSYEHRVILDGVTAFVFSVRDGGKEITVAG